MNHVPADGRRGMALLVVVVLTMLIALGAYRFSFYMESQYRLTRLHEEQVQARLVALSGIEFAASVAELTATQRANLGGLLDNPATFRHVAVEKIASRETASRSEQSDDTWRFGLISSYAQQSNKTPLSTSSTDSEAFENIRFGFENESAKLHIPTLLEWDRNAPGHARATLLALPGATEQLVDAWLSGLGVAKQRGNAMGSSLLDRLESSRENNDQQSDIDQLKLLWFGGDLNQNYRLDPLELQLSEQLISQRSSGSRPAAASVTASSDRTQPPAWQRYVTWHSGQRNETREGEPRINLNEPNLPALHQKLIAVWPANWANFVIAMRQHGPVKRSSPTLGETPSTEIETPGPDFTKPALYTFTSPLDLVGAMVQIEVASSQAVSDNKTKAPKKQTLINPFSGDSSEARNYLGRVLDAATVDASPFTIGRVDVSEAPAEVLSGVPGIDLPLAQRIVQQRSSNSGAPNTESRDTIAWLLDGGAVDMAKLKKIEPYITSRNDVYTVQSVGYRDEGSPVYRCTVTIDARQIPAQIRNHQVWHPWDRGFTMNQLNSSSP